MTASEVIQSLARAPFDTPVFVVLPNGPRFNIERIELSTEGQDKWVIVLTPNLQAPEAP